MTENWPGYEPYDPPYRGPVAQLSRSEAKESFERWVEARPERWRQLQQLVGREISVNATDDDVQALNDWFRTSLEVNPQEPTRLADRWYAVVNDVAVVLGDVLIARCPSLAWEFFTRGGKKDVAYQKHVVTGFAKAPNPKFNLDVDRLVATYAHRIIADLPVSRSYFTDLLRASQDSA